DAAALCASASGAWQAAARTSDDGFTLSRTAGASDCRFDVALDGTAHPSHPLPLPLPPDDDTVLTGRFGTWRRVTHGTTSYVEWTSGLRDTLARLPGLTVLAFDSTTPTSAVHSAVIIRRDSSLRDDYVASIDRRWQWRLPPPPDDMRATPAAVAVSP